MYLLHECEGLSPNNYINAVLCESDPWATKDRHYSYTDDIRESRNMEFAWLGNRDVSLERLEQSAIEVTTGKNSTTKIETTLTFKSVSPIQNRVLLQTLQSTVASELRRLTAFQEI